MTTFTSWDTELYHHGIKGQEHGKRRYQYEDGSLTPLGRIHYGYGQIKERHAQRKVEREARSAQKKEERRRSNPRTMTDSELRAAISRKKLENEYKELSRNRTKVLEKGAGLVEKAIDAYTEHKRQKEEQQEKQREYLLERARIQNDEFRAKALYNEKLTENQKAKLEQDKWDTHAGKTILKNESKTSLQKVKNEAKRLNLEKRNTGWFAKWRDRVFATKQAEWRADERMHEVNTLGLKNLGQEELTRQAQARAASAEQETKKAEAEYNKQLAYNEGKRLEYAENAAKRQYDREEQQAKEKREKEKEKKK